MKRPRIEAALAVGLAVILLVAGGAAIYFVVTMSVHSDPASVPSSSSVAPDDQDSKAVTESRRLARALVVEENLPGLSVAVARGGTIVWAEGFGWADVERKTPVTPVTEFRIGSVSKPLTAAAAGLLRDRGRLDFDAPVQKYVTAYPAKQWPVSVRQLMGDVAGVLHVGAGDGPERMPGRHCTGLEQALPIFASDPLLFRPGTRYRYSIYGWILASAVIEAAAGESLSGFVTRELFEPLGMTHTATSEGTGVRSMAALYFPRMAQRPDLGLQEAPEADYSCWAGAGAFVSTPSDLVRFGSAMLRPGMLTSETLAVLQTPSRLESGASTDYALGWKVERVDIGGVSERVLVHRGSPSGGTASLLAFPDRDLVVAAIANVSYGKGVHPFGVKVGEVFGGCTRLKPCGAR
jgi:serine beta-lactamase-like protein LACTB, mitochondrial